MKPKTRRKPPEKKPRPKTHWIVLMAIAVVGLAAAARLTLTPAVHPMLGIIVVQPNRLIRVYAENLSSSAPPNYRLVVTLHVGNAQTYQLTAIDGNVIGTDVDISRLTPGVYDCWITDPYVGDSNHVAINTTVSPVPEFSGPMIVAFAALGGSLVLLRRRRQ